MWGRLVEGLSQDSGLGKAMDGTERRITVRGEPKQLGEGEVKLRNEREENVTPAGSLWTTCATSQCLLCVKKESAIASGLVLCRPHALPCST